MTTTEAVIGLLMGSAGFVIAIIIAVGWAIGQRRRRTRIEDEDEEPTRFGD